MLSITKRMRHIQYICIAYCQSRKVRPNEQISIQKYFSFKKLLDVILRHVGQHFPGGVYSS